MAQGAKTPVGAAIGERRAEPAPEDALPRDANATTDPAAVTNAISPPVAATYIIRGGRIGRERLRVLSEVMAPGTASLLDRIGIRPGFRVLDVGCGGGDVATVLSAHAGAGGRVVGIDIDAEAVAIARAEAAERGVAGISYVVGDFRDPAVLAAAQGPFDLVYARFVLSHLADPDAAIATLAGAVAPGGVVAVEDVDFSGHFCFPPSADFDAYLAFYRAAARALGADPEIGQSLPARLAAAGIEAIGTAVTQPAGLDGPVKLIAPLTLSAIIPAVTAAGLADEAELVALADCLFALAEDGTTFQSAVRVVQAWGVVY